MARTRAVYAVLLAGALGACQGAAPPPAPAAPHKAAAGMFLEELGVGLLTSFAYEALDATGLFEAMGLGGADVETQRKLDEILSRLDAISAQIAELGAQIPDDVDVRATVKLLEEQKAFLATCYDELHDLVTTKATTAEAVATRNRNLHLRAYQLAGIEPPSGAGLTDDYCALEDHLRIFQQNFLQDDLAEEQNRFLVVLAREKARHAVSFQAVVQYFARAVGVQRQARAVIAEAYHRLGRDDKLAPRTADFELLLRRQAIELLRAAEEYAIWRAYDAGQPAAPAAVADAAEALALADAVAGQLEGRTRFVAAGVLAPPVDAHAPGVPRMTQAGDAAGVLLGDVMTVEGSTDTYYLSRRSHPVSAGWAFAFPRAAGNGLDVGKASRLVFHRYRSPAGAVRPDATAVTLAYGAGTPRTVPLLRRNAATLASEDAAQDRLLLAHPDGRASTAARLALVPLDGDPGHARLAAVEPARTPAELPIGRVSGTASFAARPDAADAVVEPVPAAPDEPDRLAFRLDDGKWLGVEPSSLGAAGAVPITAVASPFWFDAVRDGDAYDLSYATSDGVRRHLYVNEQIVSATDWSVVGLALPVDLLPYGITHACADGRSWDWQFLMDRNVDVMGDLPVAVDYSGAGLVEDSNYSVTELTVSFAPMQGSDAIGDGLFYFRTPDVDAQPLQDFHGSATRSPGGNFRFLGQRRGEAVCLGLRALSITPR